MKRRFQGLEETTQLAGNEVPDGLFLVRVEGVQYRRHAQKPFYWLRLAVLEPENSQVVSSPAGFTALPRPCGNSAGSCVISFMTWNCSDGRKWMRRPCSGFAASSRSAAVRSAADLSLTWRVLLPPPDGKSSPQRPCRRCKVRGWRNDLQLQPDQSIPDVSAALPTPLSR
jgi:hypothetical protein